MFARPAARAASGLSAYVGSALRCACPEKYNRAVLLSQVFVPFIRPVTIPAENPKAVIRKGWYHASQRQPANWQLLGNQH